MLKCLKGESQRDKFGVQNKKFEIAGPIYNLTKCPRLKF